MALQSSGPISISDIQSEVGISVGSSFSFQNWGGVAINQSSTNKPSPGGTESLSEWYGYEHSPPISNLYSCGISMGVSTSSAACKSVTSSIIFLNSPSTFNIAIGDTCYTSASGDTVFVGNPYKWYKIDNGDGAYAVQINSNGVILNIPLGCGF